MTKGQKAYWFAIIVIIFIILFIIVYPVSNADTIEITVDDNEVVTLTRINGNMDIDMLLYYFPMHSYNFEKRQFVTYDELGVTKEEFILLVSIVFCEAGAELESDLGQELVVVTILNRLNSGVTWWGDSITTLVDNYNQFNGVTNPKFGKITSEMDRSIINTINAIQKYNNEEYDEKYYDILYFHNPSKLDSEGYMKRYGLYPIVEIGGHLFMGEEN